MSGATPDVDNVIRRLEIAIPSASMMMRKAFAELERPPSAPIATLHTAFKPRHFAGLGSEFVMVYCENKRQDHLAFLNEINPREYRWYL